MNILHIDSSITGEASASRTITRAIVERLSASQPESAVVHRDLVSEPLEHLTLAAMANTAVLEEFLAAETIVIGAPMYNFSLPSQLKAWLDRILIAGRTFRYAAGGPEGLAGGRRVIVALSRGGFYGAGTPTAGLEHVESYLRGVFGFIGIEPEFVLAEGVNIGPDERHAAIAQAIDEVERLAA